MSSSFKIRPTHFSCGGKIFLGRLRTPWLRACGHLYITKNKRLLAYFMCILNSCVVWQDLILQTRVCASQSSRTRSVLNCSYRDLSPAWYCSCKLLWRRISVFHSPVLTRSLIFLQLWTAVS